MDLSQELADLRESRERLVERRNQWMRKMVSRAKTPAASFEQLVMGITAGTAGRLIEPDDIFDGTEIAADLSFVEREILALLANPALGGHA